MQEIEKILYDLYHCLFYPVKSRVALSGMSGSRLCKRRSLFQWIYRKLEKILLGGRRHALVSVVSVLCVWNVDFMKAQSVSFALKTSPAINFDFVTIPQFQAGITRMGVCELNVEAVGTQWDLYVGTTTLLPGYWDEVVAYSSVGEMPPVSILQVRIRNVSDTPWVSGFFALTDLSTPTYLIGSAMTPDAAAICPQKGTNVAGSYVTNPGCYRFFVDLKLIPGFGLKPGVYTLRIDYIISEDL